jgi:hypothetical protein
MAEGKRSYYGILQQEGNTVYLLFYLYTLDDDPRRPKYVV